MRGVTLLGSTGSIGVNTLDVLSRHPDRYRVVALAARSQADKLFEQCRQHRPEVAVMLDTDAAGHLRERIRSAGLATVVKAGASALEEIARDERSSVVVAGIVGSAGLQPTLAAVRAGKRVLFANKEPLVMCGQLFIDEARRSGAQLMPVDSEHNAIFQCMPAGYRPGEHRPEVKRIFLTCSGGPFRQTPAADLARVTPEQACAHPNWVMGRKISVDSATLMNKGLELIEACWLFHVSADQVEVVIHPQSIIHSAVSYADGSVLAQLGNPDMRTPIAHALAWPERIEAGVQALDLLSLGQLEFGAPDVERFPCLRLAQAAARDGGTAPTVLNAANEVAVQAFLDRRIGFTDIPLLIEGVRRRLPVRQDVTLDSILAEDARARETAVALVGDMTDTRHARAGR
ncbi:MAG: 1-deoxy-D-xylulose-5-phosphate reductoisomerase [Candidatus Muproteobacteria bacterium RBG_16_62_13]|uniref:1-deoxy-D-xylulose 5-phosphate reductoisomerase n=1 Tax=Candidatus Muproteobacteria bacterium RBG_16_62_13 TaxID=1817756 RepID=A0A1F6T9D4_9PROT|nr:MAG: 1-deoxy-D-xylulose-5-phosphate reductoisomerase [Candidatus Muproteobacteria bacterium RBG_16_62_13]